MQAPTLNALLRTGLLLGLSSLPAAHGGQYRGPGDLVPPGGGGFGGGGGNPSPGAGGAPAPAPPGLGPIGPRGVPANVGSAAGGFARTGDRTASVDLTQWSFWWESNKEPYLDLKAVVHAQTPTTGSDGWWLGSGQRDEASSLQPTEEEIQGEVVPALLHALENETSNDIVTACLIALAKIGDEKSESGASRFEALIAARLASNVQEIAETAAVALGILANDHSVPVLTSLLADDERGRALVGAAEVDVRTRAFAAYGLAQIGARTGSEEVRREIVAALHEVLAGEPLRQRDVGAACVIALGLVPLETLEAAPDATPGEARQAQIEFLLGYLADERQDPLTRGHVPTALARLFRGPDASRPTPWPEGLEEPLETRIADALLAALETSRHNSIQSGSALALGLLGDLDGDPLDVRIRAALAAAPKQVADQQTRFFALIGMARLCANHGNGNIEPGLADVERALLHQLARGKSTARPWAGLAVGVACEALARANIETSHTLALKEALRESLRAEESASRVGAYALACGIARDQESAPLLIDKLERLNDDEALGYTSVALGLLGERGAIGAIQEVLRGARYRPALLKQAAIALGLLGNKKVVGELTAMLQDSDSLASQAAVASALGIIGDTESIDPLLTLLGDPEKTDLARAFAAAALGIVGDRASLPWNAKVGVDLNYRATTPTLNDPGGASGILNIL